MQSNQIEQYAKEIDKSVNEIVSVAKEDYKTRLAAIKDINGYSYELISMMQTSKSALTQGGVGEMQRVQKEQNRKLESEINKVDSKLSSMKGNSSSAEDMVYLVGKLEGWIKRFDDLSIPSGPYSSAYKNTASSSMQTMLKKWKDFCQNDPIIKKAELYGQKSRLEEEIKKLKNTIDTLEAKLPKEKAELQDRKDNSEKYRLQVEDETKQIISTKKLNLESLSDDLRNQEAKIERLKTMLSSAGLFAFGKKKELKAQIQSTESETFDIKEKIRTAEIELKAVEDSLPRKIKELERKITSLEEQVKLDSEKLEKSKKELADKEQDLNKIEAKLK